MIKLTKEHICFLRRGSRRMTIKELTAAFAMRFGIPMTEGRIRGATRRYKMLSGRTGYFEKGFTPWNKGLKGYMGANKTSFKKGSLPHNHRPLWSERLGKGGYIEMSVPERNPYTGFRTRYKHKHVWLWEQKHGPKPEGTAVIFKDGNTLNFRLENLLLVMRAELLSMNLHGYKEASDELKPSIMALAKLEAKAGIRIRHGRIKRGDERCRRSLI